MGKQQTKTKSKRPNFVGKGKIKPIQVAFIVDRYLFDNNFTQSRSTFQTEAAHFLSKCRNKEAPKSLLGLSDILEEYLTLKEQKVWVEQERCRLEQENLRVQNFLQGMQNVMNVYNCESNLVVVPSVPLPPSVAVTPIGNCPMYKSSSMVSVLMPFNRMYSSSLTTPVTTLATSKRKRSKDVSGNPVTLKKSRQSTQSKDVEVVTRAANVETHQEQSSAPTQLPGLDNAPVNGSQVQGSNVVKRLFNQKTPSNSAVPETPPQGSASETDKSKSPICSNAAFSTPKRSQRTMSTNCTIMSSETIHLTPDKQIAYYSIEKRSVTTCSPAKSSPRCSSDRVKGRLNFDSSDSPTIIENQSPGGTSTSESDKEGDVLDFCLDDLGPDFNLSEFLLEFEKETEGLGVSAQQELNSSPDSIVVGEPGISVNFLVDSRQQISSDMTENLADTDMNLMGSGSISTMRSITKRVILSPVKNQSYMNQENTPTKH